MAKDRFQYFERRLCEAGVARRHARRAATEIRSHHAQQVEAARAAGLAPEAARAEADARIGSDELLIERFASRPELRAFSSRRPLLAYSVLPMAVLVVAVVALFTMLATVPGALHLGLQSPTVLRSAIAIKVLTLWIGPVALSASCTLLAWRHRMALRWPLLTVILVCALGALVNLTATYDDSGPVPAGSLGLGLGFPPPPDQIERGVITLAIGLIPLALMALRWRRSRDTDAA